MPIMLSKEEVKDFTGASHTAKQIEWLSNKGYKFEVNAAGEVKLLYDHIKQRLCDSVELEKNNRTLNEKALLRVIHGATTKKIKHTPSA